MRLLLRGTLDRSQCMFNIVEDSDKFGTVRADVLECQSVTHLTFNEQIDVLILHWFSPQTMFFGHPSPLLGSKRTDEPCLNPSHHRRVPVGSRKDKFPQRSRTQIIRSRPQARGGELP